MKQIEEHEKEKIIKLFNEGLTQKEIAKQTNRGISTIQRTLSANGLHAKRDNSFVRKLKKCNDAEFTEEQYEIIYGTLLGDSSLQLSSKKCVTPALTSCHSEKQKDYSFLLSKKLFGHCKKRERYDKRTNKIYVSYDVRTLSNVNFLPIYNELYKTGKKQVTKEYAEKLTARSLAFWFMDDGYVHDNTFILCTDSFNEESCNILCETISEKFGITFRKLKHGNNFRLRLIFDDRAKFIDMVSPFIIDCMKYKLIVDTSYKPHTINFRHTTETFIKKARKIHGDTYDYSKTTYNGNNITKVKIICKKHGEFWQTPAQHFNGHGCPKCGLEKRRRKKETSD